MCLAKSPYAVLKTEPKGLLVPTQPSLFIHRRDEKKLTFSESFVVVV